MKFDTNPDLAEDFSVHPENSELSEASLENLLIAMKGAIDREGKPIRIVPTHIHFTEEALRKYFGWTDSDFKVWPAYHHPDAIYSLRWQRLAALLRCAEVLRLQMPCSCQHNVPYAGGAIEQKVTVQCGRCKALEEFDRS